MFMFGVLTSKTMVANNNRYRRSQVGRDLKPLYRVSYKTDDENVDVLGRSLGQGRRGAASLGECGDMAPPTRTVPYPCPQAHNIPDGDGEVS